MAQKIENAIVGIKDKDGKYQGTGFVIADKVIVTCAHVIRAVGAQPGDEVKVVFGRLNRTEYLTKVSSDGYNADNDIAILLGQSPLPLETQPVILSSPNELNTPIQFKTFGYRNLGEREGPAAFGTLVGPVLAETSSNPPSHPSLILESTQMNRGMSGAPLYIPRIDRVVGIIKSFWDTKGEQGDQNTARAMPAEVIVEAWPMLEFKAKLNKSADTLILETLLSHDKEHPGQPEMKLSILLESTGFEKNECLHLLRKLKENGWINFKVTEDGDVGLVWLTSEGSSTISNPI